MSVARSDTITFATPATADVTLAKVVNVAQDGRLLDKEPSPNVFAHNFTEAQVANLDGLFSVLMGAARSGAIAVRGRAKAPTGRRAIYDDAEKGPAGLEPMARLWVALDWDQLPLEPLSDPQPPEIAEDPAEMANWSLPDPLLDPEIGVQSALRCLPAAFQSASCIWQVTASAGFSDFWRLRTWHWLSYPATGEQIKEWLKPAIDRNLLDPVTLRDAQPHYLGITVIGGRDPCPERWGVLRGAGGDTVRIPDLEALVKARKARERISRLPAPPPGSEQGGTYAERRVNDCIAAIRSAPDGQKHPTYVTEAARARALCERYGLTWGPIERDLVATYEGTLSAAEAARRRQGSTLGTVRWLARRESG